MLLPNSLQRGTLIKRYKRFLSDIELESGEVIQAHCPNSGSMMGLKDPGEGVWVSRADNPNRKLKYTWELVEMPDSLVGINTNYPNKLVHEALLDKKLEAFEDYKTIQPEKTCAPGTRLDFYLPGEKGQKDAYIEVKNVTLKESGQALFPDAVTERGQKHIRVLMDLVKAGHRGALVYVVQRQDVQTFAPARQIDPVYADLLIEAEKAGVEIYCYTCHLTTKAIILSGALPINLG